MNVYLNNLNTTQITQQLTTCVDVATRTERDLVSSLNLEYYRITELDHREQSNDNLDKLVILFDRSINSLFLDKAGC